MAAALGAVGASRRDSCVVGRQRAGWWREQRRVTGESASRGVEVQAGERAGAPASARVLARTSRAVLLVTRDAHARSSFHLGTPRTRPREGEDSLLCCQIRVCAGAGDLMPRATMRARGTWGAVRGLRARGSASESAFGRARAIRHRWLRGASRSPSGGIAGSTAAPIRSPDGHGSPDRRSVGPAPLACYPTGPQSGIPSRAAVVCTPQHSIPWETRIRDPGYVVSDRVLGPSAGDQARSVAGSDLAGRRRTTLLITIPICDTETPARRSFS